MNVGNVMVFGLSNNALLLDNLLESSRQEPFFESNSSRNFLKGAVHWGVPGDLHHQ